MPTIWRCQKYTEHDEDGDDQMAGLVNMENTEGGEEEGQGFGEGEERVRGWRRRTS